MSKNAKRRANKRARAQADAKIDDPINYPEGPDGGEEYHDLEDTRTSEDTDDFDNEEQRLTPIMKAQRAHIKDGRGLGGGKGKWGDKKASIYKEDFGPEYVHNEDFRMWKEGWNNQPEAYKEACLAWMAAAKPH